MIQNQAKKNILSSSILLFFGILQIAFNIAIIIMLFIDNNLTTFSNFRNIDYNNSLIDLFKCKSFTYGDYKYMYNRSYLTIVNLMMWLICLICIPCIIGIVILFKKYVLNQIKYFVYETDKIKRSVFLLEGMILFLDGLVFGYLFSFYYQIKAMNCTSNLIIDYRKSYLKYFIVSASTLVLGIGCMLQLSAVKNIIENNQTDMRNIFETNVKKSIKNSKIMNIDKLESERGLNHDDKINTQKIGKLASTQGFQMHQISKQKKVDSHLQSQINQVKQTVQPEQVAQNIEKNYNNVILDWELNSIQSQKQPKIETVKIPTENVIQKKNSVSSTIRQKQNQYALLEAQKNEPSKIEFQNFKKKDYSHNQQNELFVQSSLKANKQKKQYKLGSEQIMIKTKLDPKIQRNIIHMANIQNDGSERKSNSQKKNNSEPLQFMKINKINGFSNRYNNKKSEGSLKSDETFTKEVKDQMQIIQIGQND